MCMLLSSSHHISGWCALIHVWNRVAVTLLCGHVVVDRFGVAAKGDVPTHPRLLGHLLVNRRWVDTLWLVQRLTLDIPHNIPRDPPGLDTLVLRKYPGWGRKLAGVPDCGYS
eukprot:TRINITY_DN2608_c0_g1_i2.p1 TRINITY_DN2608_c0_g1~~TRINITY_DN2608_c0_g1_i2.p1  ORF type:complete len:112 (+),score=31.54 TRINITY_DN2608_c0_g1_i2:457-792(+)